jgi:hypothetical protein
VISRSASRDNKSKYYVDGKVVTFKAVADLLMTKGVDLNNNRFLILQVGQSPLSVQIHYCSFPVLTIGVP